ncbi:MAG TPA: hypothetical protein VN645_05660 [Steroidobacteraceae bacterium]|nr:hypothetical protein [Steroidobacteraceae bacterium]
MSGARGKGKISNELVAASCAAVLAVYAAGYWRTRDEARRMDTRAQQRRPVQSEPRVASRAQPDTTEAAIPAGPPVEVRPLVSLPDVSVDAQPATVASQLPTKAIAAKPTPPVASPPATSASPEPRAATETITSATEPEPAPLSIPETLATPSENWRDGTYTGWGTSRHGDIKAQVVIKDGRIVDSSIASCETRYPCDVISHIIHQPVERQKPDVDHVSRATESADAYYYGLVDALTQALVQPADAATKPR